jgi:general secretion pathway protein J
MRRRSGGFTLIEVLISITLLSTIMAILWGTFSNSTRLRDVATLKYDRIRAVQMALRRMQTELSMAFITKIGAEPTNERGEVTYQTALIGDRDRVDFTNFAHMRTRVNEVASEQAEISYFVRSQRGRDGRLHQNLLRREQAPIDGNMEEGGTLYTLLEDIESLEFEYWRPDRDIAGDSWETSWDTRDTGVEGLPPRIRITLEIADPLRERERLTFVAQAEIPLTEPIGFAYQNITGEVVERNGQQIEQIWDGSSDDFDSDEVEGP